MTLQIGDTAPDFEAVTTEGRIGFHNWIEDVGGAFLPSEGLHSRIVPQST